MTSSLYEPNTALLERFNGIAELCRVVSREDVTTSTLDSLRDQIGPVDWIKIDVQGGELAVIEGAKELLQSVVRHLSAGSIILHHRSANLQSLVVHQAIVEVEVEFVPLYANQPLFADVDRALREQGFVFHRFSSQQGRCMKPLSIAGTKAVALLYLTDCSTHSGDVVCIVSRNTVHLAREDVCRHDFRTADRIR